MGVDPVAAADAVLSCDDELASNLGLFEEEIIKKDADERSEECDTLDSL